uniref:Uncharacterized protein n=1 Tax=Physcomitrium patens TaxID=3218 RepID=A0A2K1JMX3_PHYPA|nr:hypothetical protein PHYPA_017720 [Physcomitrium patens]
MKHSKPLITSKIRILPNLYKISKHHLNYGINSNQIYLRIFGCKACIFILKEIRKKLDFY